MNLRYKLNLSIVLLLVFLTSCAIRVTSHYDSYSDDLTMSFSKEISTLLEVLQKDISNGPEFCNIVNYQDYYVRLNSTLYVLELRNAKRNRNNITRDNISKLDSLLRDFETLHNKRSTQNECVPEEELKLKKDQFREVLIRLTDLELYKKSKAGKQR